MIQGIADALINQADRLDYDFDPLKKALFSMRESAVSLGFSRRMPSAPRRQPSGRSTGWPKISRRARRSLNIGLTSQVRAAA
jgi:hypothetical protein